MPYPHDARNREPSDARAALMAKLPSQFPPYVDVRSRYLQAERLTPYRAVVRPKRPLLAECRKNRLVPSLGWGAFLKDETLRNPQGQIVRAATGPCPRSPSTCGVEELSSAFSCGGKRESNSLDECRRLRWEKSSLKVHRVLRRPCQAAHADTTIDSPMPLWILDPETGTQGPRRMSSQAVATAGDLDCEMPSQDILEHDAHLTALFSGPMCEPEGMSERLCAQAADEMFSMFIEESCMEEEDYELTSILSYSTSI